MTGAPGFQKKTARLARSANLDRMKSWTQRPAGPRPQSSEAGWQMDREKGCTRTLDINFGAVREKPTAENAARKKFQAAKDFVRS